MKNTDSKSHLRGESIYLDDIPELQGTLYGLVFDSPVAHAENLRIDYSKAENLDGVVKIFTYKDIPGKNQIGAIIQDEPLFAENEVHFTGQPIAFIVAESERIARDAKKLIEFDADELPVITDPKIAKENESFIIPPRTFKLGNLQKGKEKSKYIIKGTSETGGQEHLYLETQGAYAVPKENGSITLYSSTQGATSVQKITSEILNVSMNKIEVDVNRLGGGFGGKEDQATPWAAMASLAAYILHKPVKISLARHDDMRMTGKRHPYTADYAIGLSEDLKIQFYEVEFIQDGGASADLSPAIMERTLFHAAGSYFIPNTEITVFSCRTNTLPNTAFRGFGAPQAFFAIESAVQQAADEIGVPAHKIQRANLIKENDEFPFGQIATQAEAINSWKAADKIFNIDRQIKEVKKFNSENTKFKKGISITPLCFGISFTNTMMNHARALVHIYQDGSIGISTGAIEMGQGVNTKMIQVASHILGVSVNKIKIETTNTTRVANTSPTAASSGADLNGKAVEVACNELLVRLKDAAAEFLNLTSSDVEIKNDFVLNKNKKTDLGWNKLIEVAFAGRVKLSEKGHYATPEIHFDKTKEKGHPFAYHVYGTAITVAKIDTIRGIFDIESVDIVHDFGKSMNLLLDKGQIEGALIQGIGWVTMEEIRFDEKGRLLSNSLSSYKVPDINSVPKSVKVEALETEGHKHAILKSKAVGEPPLIYGQGTYFAVSDAIKAYNPNYKIDFTAPMTHEKVLTGLYKE
ncbi:MAG: molybdopterin-dependent oxidoreductase [Bacteroidales bacterium]|nr:molybdopterin-dependent oxidoreductase [Bacteroidales bacterium]